MSGSAEDDTFFFCRKNRLTCGTVCSICYNVTLQQMGRSSSCAPGVSSIFGSCYRTEDLIRLADAWNARHPDDPVTGNRRELIMELRKRFSSCCESERCWIRTLVPPKLATAIEYRTFAPIAPASWRANPNTWLRSTDISHVMRKVEALTPEFEFIGPSPIDFDVVVGGSCVWPRLCNYRISDSVEAGKSKTGFVFNLDTHDGPGTHWVAMWLHPSAGQLMYFDSLGDPPPDEIKSLAERMKDQGVHLGRDISFSWNTIEHQKKQSECGIYAIYFLTELALGTTPPSRFLQKPRITDRNMFKKRSTFFDLQNR